LVLSLIDAAGSASGTIVQNFAEMRAADAPKLQQRENMPTYFEWLFLQPIKNPPLKLKPAVARTKAD
jgi:hypothetical protein